MSEDLHEFDVALSFGGEDRQAAENLANGLREFGVRVFYDRHEQATLWGKDLYQHLQTVYRDKAKYCLIFVSRHYAKKVWTKPELRQAQARAIAEEREYILPLRLDDTELPGLNSAVGYVDLRTNELAAVQDLLLRKLFGDDYGDADRAELTWRGELVPFRGDEVAAFWPDKLNAAQTKPSIALLQKCPDSTMAMNEAGLGISATYPVTIVRRYVESTTSPAVIWSSALCVINRSSPAIVGMMRSFDRFACGLRPPAVRPLAGPPRFCVTGCWSERSQVERKYASRRSEAGARFCPRGRQAVPWT